MAERAEAKALAEEAKSVAGEAKSAVDVTDMDPTDDDAETSDTSSSSGSLPPPRLSCASRRPRLPHGGPARFLPNGELIVPGARRLTIKIRGFKVGIPYVETTIGALDGVGASRWCR